MGSQQQATIRFKVEGLEVASKSFEQLARKATAEAVNIQKYTGQGRYEKALAEKERLAATTTEILKKASMSQYDFEVDRVKAVFDYRIKAAKGNVDAETALMVSRDAQLQQLAAKQQGGAGGAGGDRMGGALSGFGGKMLLGHAAGIATGDILGDQHGGREIGAAVGGFMFGGPVVGAAVMGMEVIGTAFRTHRENLEATRKSEQDLKNTTLELSNTWANMATSLVERNSFGKAMESEYKRATAAAEKFYDVAQQQRYALTTGFMPGISFGEALMQGLTGEKPGSLTAYRTSLNQTEEERSDAAFARSKRNEEYPKQIAARKELLETEIEMNEKTSAMRPGGLKEKELIQNKYLLQGKALAENQREQNALAEAAVVRTTAKHKVVVAEIEDNKRLIEIAKGRVEHLKGTLDRGINDNERQAMIERSKKEILMLQEKQNKLIHNEEVTETNQTEAENAKTEREGDFQQKAAEQDAAKVKELAEFEMKEKLQLEAQTEKTAEAQIRSEKLGYEQRAAVRDSAFAFEEIKAAEHGEKMLQSIKDMHAAIKKEDERELMYKYTVQQAEEDIDLQLAQHKLTIAEAGRQRALAANPDANIPEVRKAIDKSEATKEEAAVTRDIYKYTIEKEQIALQYAEKRHLITQREADFERMRLADPRAKEGNKEILNQIKAVADARQALRDAEIVHVGQFSGAYSPGRVNFEALNQDRPLGALKGPGTFSGGFGANVNTAGLNNDFAHGGDQAQRQTTLQQLMVTLLQQIAQNHGLN